MHDNKIILFEKKSERYEESASVLFEKLIDEGYKNVFYILDKNNKNLHKINRKYKRNIIDKYTFKHYLYFFTAKTMIGTEMLSHSIDLRIANKYAMKKINSKRLNFVFLQHGVMYMIQIASKTRKFFHKDKNTGLKRVVVSSKLEADHFTNYAKYENKDMYICGLPKFDKNKWTKDADKIIIMPTWRPWEYNQSRLSFTETPYFKMIKRIFESIPEVYKDKIIILPDRVCDNLDFIETNFVANIENKMKYEEANEFRQNYIYEWFRNNNSKFVTKYSNENDITDSVIDIRIKSLEINNILTTTLAMRILGVYLGIVLLMISLTIL